MKRHFEDGTIVQHFKREVHGDFLYQVLFHAEDAKTGEEYVVYREMFGKERRFVRKAEDFYAERNAEKYPGYKQQYKYEKFDDFANM